MKEFSEVLQEISTDGADLLLKNNAFSGSTYARGRLPISIRENKHRIKKLNSLFSNKKFIKQDKFQEFFLNYLITSDNAPLISFLITYFSERNPENFIFASQALSILITKVQKSKKEVKWKYLYVIEQLLRNIFYNAKFDKLFIDSIDKLYPHFINMDKKKPLIQNEYDENAHIQFTFILFSYICFKKDELRKHTEKNQIESKEDENQSNSHFDF